MPPIDGSTIILSLLGIAGALIVFIYIDDRLRYSTLFKDHGKRLSDLEEEVSEIKLIQRDIEYIRKTLDEIKARGH